ncbi:MAG: single-stranded-DNA-specific exonuclease RecJ, partial [Oscillospiraceae bacterium]|nr:single-stranded-DNA-specific exonuclease RecJ [Oscillospiraceae bacterium]
LEEDIDSVVEQWGDLCAIGTVGDIVPLVGENRTLVKRGLENLQLTENRGLYALLRKSGISEDKEVSSVDLAFTVCPRINAAGRFGHPKEAAELFLCENDTMIPVMAERLSMLNTQRKQAEEEILKEIAQAVENDPLLLKKRVITVCGKGWSHGVIGIVASRLLNRYGKPVLIITDEGGTSRGSARSVEGFSLFRMLTELSDCLTKFGGHTKAAGFSLDTDRTEEFVRAVDAYAAKNFPEMPVDTCTAEMKLTAAELTEENVESLSYFQPFGEANPEPIFMLENCRIKSVRSLSDGKYVSFSIDFQGREFKVVNFRSTYDAFGYKAEDKTDLLVTAEINEYNGSRSISLRLADIRYSGFEQDRFFAAQRTYEKLCLGEEIPASLARRVIPDREAQKAVYDAVKATGSIAAAADIAYSKGINYCMFRVTLDAFEDTGLIKINHSQGSFTLLESGKVDLDNCPYMTDLRKRLGQ